VECAVYTGILAGACVEGLKLCRGTFYYTAIHKAATLWGLGWYLPSKRPRLNVEHKNASLCYGVPPKLDQHQTSHELRLELRKLFHLALLDGLRGVVPRI